MIPNLTLVLVSGALVGTGAYLLLARSVVRALLGVVMFSNGVNVLFLIASGPAGQAPILREGVDGGMADPVPQALVLTAIVITLAMTAFVLALAHRSWQLDQSDLVADDPESARIHSRAEADDMDGPSAADEAEAIAADFAEEDEGR